MGVGGGRAPMKIFLPAFNSLIIFVITCDGVIDCNYMSDSFVQNYVETWEAHARQRKFLQLFKFKIEIENK